MTGTDSSKVMVLHLDRHGVISLNWTGSRILMNDRQFAVGKTLATMFLLGFDRHFGN